MTCPTFSRRQFLATAGFGGMMLLTRSPGQSSATGGFGAIVPFAIDGDRLVVPAGRYRAGDLDTRVAREARLAVAPPDIVRVDREALLLSEMEPRGFFVGTRLRGPTTSSIAAFNSLVPESLVVTDAAGRELVRGEDYLLSAPFALLGLGPRSRVTPATEVYASYSHCMQRIDAVVVDDGGNTSLMAGRPRLVSPEVPAVPAGAAVIARIYRPFRARSLAPEHVFPVTATSAGAVTATTPGRISRTMAKLAAGEPVTVVCWGDSITVGADVASGDAWANRLRATLAERFPRTQFKHANHSIGGTKSAQWLANGDFPGLPKQNPDKCRFDLVLAEKPDVVVMEFLNDIVFKEDVLQRTYAEISRRFKAAGIEWVIVTPSSKIPESFDLAAMKDPQPRLLDDFQRKFAAAEGHALADAAARWRHLAAEGIPYFSLFNNGYNHPNAQGHWLFVEEIMKCFTA